GAAAPAPPPGASMPNFRRPACRRLAREGETPAELRAHQVVPARQEPRPPRNARAHRSSPSSLRVRTSASSVEPCLPEGSRCPGWQRKVFAWIRLGGGAGAASPCVCEFEQERNVVGNGGAEHQHGLARNAENRSHIN